MSQPSELQSAASAAGSIAALLNRAADCLTALLRSPTAAAGVNESRYKVLDALRHVPGESATQAELAARLLQSESNLSTLLDRMQQDGLISRIRSETDRRKSLIRMSAAGAETMHRADHERNAAAARFLRELDGDRAAALRRVLEHLVDRFERELGIALRNMNSAPQPGHSVDSRAGVIPNPHFRADSSRAHDHSPISNGHSS